MALTLDLALVKQFIGIDPLNTTEDALLQIYIGAVISAIKMMTGRNLERAIYLDAIYTDRGEGIYLREWPLDITTVFTFDDTKAMVIQADSPDYDVYPDTGYVRFINGINGYVGVYGRAYATFGFGAGFGFIIPRFVVAYIGGYDVLPEVLQVAALYAVQSARAYAVQTNQYGGQLRRLSVYDVGVADFALPTGGTGTNVLQDTLAAHLVGTPFDSLSMASIQQHTRLFGPAPALATPAPTPAPTP